jgi:hypothetical protein
MKKLLFTLMLVIGCSAGADYHPQPEDKTDCTTDESDTLIEFSDTEHMYLLPGAFTDEQSALIADAANQWTEATNGTLSMTFEVGWQYPFMYSADLSESIVGTEWSDLNHKPVIAIETKAFTYPDPYPDGEVIFHANDFREVVMHEMGHAYGLVHHVNPSGLMNPSINGTNCIDWDTIQQYCLHRSCPNGFKSTCPEQ